MSRLSPAVQARVDDMLARRKAAAAAHRQLPFKAGPTAAHRQPDYRLAGNRVVHARSGE